MNDVNAKNRYGETPLMLAAERGDMDEVRRLLAAGADVLAADNENATAAKKAERAGHRNIVELLHTVEKGGETTVHASVGDHRQKTTPPDPPGLKDCVYTSAYGTARGAAKLVAFLGWVVVVCSGIGIVAGLSLLGGGNIANAVTAIVVITSAFVIALLGLLLVIMGQMTRATVDVADHTGQMVELLHNRSAG